MLIIIPPIVFGAVSPEYVTYIQLLIACCFLVWIAKTFIKGAFTYIPTPLDRPFLIFLLLGILNLFTSVYPHNTEKALFLLLCYGILFVLVLQQLKTRRRIFGLAFIILLIGTGESLFGLFQYLRGAKTVLGVMTPNIGTVNATYMSHNHFAGFLIVILPLALGLFAGTANLEKKFFLFLLFGIMGSSLVLTLSRGGLLSFLLASLVFVSCLVLKHRAMSERTISLWKYLVVTGLVVLLVAGYVAWIGISPIAHRSLLDTFFPTKAVVEHEIRLPLWKSALGLVRESPVLGSGMGTFQYVFMRYRPPEIPQDLQAYHAHNDYLELLIETGIPGFLIAVWGIVSFFRFMLRGYFRHHDPVLSPLALGGMTSITAMLIHSVFDFNLQIPANALLFCSILALSISIVHLMDRGSTRSSSKPSSTKSRSKRRDTRLYPFAIGAVCMTGILLVGFRGHLAMFYYRNANRVHYEGQRFLPIELCQKAIRIDPLNPRFRLRLAEIYTEFGRKAPHKEKWYTLAIQEYRRVIDLNPYNPEYYTRLAEVYDAIDLKEDAIQAFQEAIRVNPRVATHYEQLGNYYLEHGQVEPALQEFQQALRYNPARLPLLVRICQQQGLAYSTYQQLISDDAENRKIFASLLARQRLWEESKAEYRKAIDLSGKQQSYYDALLNACQSHKDFSCMRAVWRELWEQHPDNLEYPVRIARSFIRQQKWNEADAVYQQLLEQHPNNPELSQQVAKLYEQRGQANPAINMYKKLLSLQPDKVEFYHKIAALYRQQKNWNSAIEIYETALEKGLTQAGIYAHLGELFLQTQEHQRAREFFERAVQKGETRLHIYTRLEELYLKHQNQAALDVLWTTYILENKQKPKALFQLVRHYRKQGEWLEAVNLLKEIIVSTPNNVTYRRFLAGLYEQHEMYYEALDQWEHLVNSHPRKIEFLLHTASLYENVGQLAAAKTFYRKILNIQPSHQRAAQRLAYLE